VNERIQPPIHGPYNRRAEVVVAELSLGLAEKFGTGIKCARRDFDQKKTYSWELPSRVKICVEKAAGSADPAVWVLRRDPHNTPSPGGDWKNQEFGRSLKDKHYHLGEIIEKAAAAVTYNQERSATQGQNADAMKAELEGLEIPAFASITRDPATGKYELKLSATFKNIDAGELKRLVVTMTPALNQCGERKSDGPPPDQQ
jgi:hypothetical protein